MKKKDLKSIITLLTVITLCLSFCYAVVVFCDSDIANQIVSTFLTMAISVVGFYIGYQNNKPKNNDKEGE